MPSTFTSGLRLTNQANGENESTWGDIADNNYLFLDKAVTGIVGVDLTGSGSHTLTVNNGATDEARNALIRVSGIPTSANSVIIPASEKMYDIHMTHTSVSGGITIRTAAGTGVNYLTGQKGRVYCDGVSVYDLNPTVSALDPSNNLSDLENVSSARVNISVDHVGVSLDSTLAVTSGALGVVASGILAGVAGLLYPVGTIYSNRTDSTNPATLFGVGTWIAAGVGRVLVGVGAGTDINAVTCAFAAETCGGEYVHTLTVDELASHSHTLKEDGEVPTGNSSRRGVTTGSGNSNAGAIVSAGGDSPHNIQQPWYSVYMWERTA
jgi:hypothetical protein